MIAPIGPGDQARCIDARPHHNTGESWLVLGRVYRIAGMAMLEFFIEGDRSDRTWCPTRFEPLDSRSFEHLLKKAEPQRELQRA